VCAVAHMWLVSVARWFVLALLMLSRAHRYIAGEMLFQKRAAANGWELGDPAARPRNYREA
jgi:hypothetical protein